MTEREELAWAAGLFDGEGSVGAYKRPRSGRNVPSRHLRVTVSQKDRRVLDRFQRAVGVGVVRYVCARPAPYVWDTSRREHIMLVAWLLWPWLDEIKREQFDRAFVRYHEIWDELHAEAV